MKPWDGASAMSKRHLACLAVADELRITVCDAMDEVAKICGFYCYSAFADWHNDHPDIPFDKVQGPNAMFLLHMLIAQYEIKP